jgi:hypothetical protein
MEAIISNIHTNCLGTTDFDMKLTDMRKPQEFSVYPIDGKKESLSDGTVAEIMIQSDKRIGTLSLATGKGKITKTYSNGAYFPHYTMDKAMNKLIDFELKPVDIQALKLYIYSTASKRAGDGSGVVSDNSGAARVI